MNPLRVIPIVWIVALALPGPLSAQYSPPDCTGAPMFTDVQNNHDFCPWIEALARDGIVSECGPPRYCPDAPVTRAQLALHLVKQHDRLWGQGRPGVVMHAPENDLNGCQGDGDDVYLSQMEVGWGDAAAACPAGTWVCTSAERGSDEDSARGDE